MSDTDRTIHAEAIDGAYALVRYDRDGKWYLEWPDGRRQRMSVGAAAYEAVSWSRSGGQVYLGRLGGRRFDRIVRQILDGST